MDTLLLDVVNLSKLDILTSNRKCKYRHGTTQDTKFYRRNGGLGSSFISIFYITEIIEFGIAVSVCTIDRFTMISVHFPILCGIGMKPLIMKFKWGGLKT